MSKEDEKAAITSLIREWLPLIECDEEKTASKGEPAEAALGLAFHLIKESREILLRRVEQGDAEACRALSISYSNGITPVDVPRLFRKYLFKGAKLGSVSCAYRCSLQFWAGRDLAELLWLKRAAKLGHSYSAERVGDAYHLGLGVEADEEEAAKWYKLKEEILEKENRIE